MTVAINATHEAVAGALLSLTPVFAVPISCWLLREPMRWQTLIGTCVAAAGVIVAVFGSIYVANQVVGSPTSLLPPYFEEKDLHRVLPDGKIYTGPREHFIAPGGASNFSDVKPSGR